MEFARITARYDTPCELFAKNEYGEYLTRRDHYEQMGVDTVERPPEIELPDDGYYLWQIFTEIDCAIARCTDGYFTPILPTEWQAWLYLTGRNITFEEFEILNAIDVVHCSELNKDVRAIQERNSSKPPPKHY